MAEGTPVDSKEEPNLNLAFPHTDGALEVENQIVYVSKSRLSAASPVFKSMFESDFKEKDMKVIKLPGKKVEDVELFLDSIYRSNKKLVTVETVMQILPLAHEYMVKDLLSECETIIIQHCDENIKVLKTKWGESTTITLNELVSYLEACEKFSLQESLLETAVELASLVHYSKLQNLEGFISLSDATKLLITEKRLNEFEKIYIDAISTPKNYNSFKFLFRFDKLL